MPSAAKLLISVAGSPYLGNDKSSDLSTVEVGVAEIILRWEYSDISGSCCWPWAVKVIALAVNLGTFRPSDRAR